MKLEWSPLAQADRQAIFDYIEADQPDAAITLDVRIRDQIEILNHYPDAGRSGRVQGTRELVISRTPYIAVYRVAGDGIKILRILHGARCWPEASE